MLTRECCKYLFQNHFQSLIAITQSTKKCSTKKKQTSTWRAFFTSTCHCQSVSLPRNQESGTWRTWRDPGAKTTWQLLQDYKRWFVVRQNISVDPIVLTYFVTRFFRLWRLSTYCTSTKKIKKLYCVAPTLYCVQKSTCRSKKKSGGRHDKSY